MGSRSLLRLLNWGPEITDGLEKELRTEIAALRDELKATAAKLHERLARLPIVKEFQPETVYYPGRTLRESSHRRNVVTLRLVRYRHHLLENCWRGCRSCSVLMP